MTAGTQYFVVISTYGTGITGHVDLTASGPGNMDVVEVATVCRGTQSTAESEPEPWIRGDQKMVCYQAWINSDNAFEFVFWYEYADNNWVRIYDMNGNMVYEVDMPYGDAHFTADLPDGMYTVKTFHDQPEPLQEFIIGKP